LRFTEKILRVQIAPKLYCIHISGFRIKI